MRKTPAALVVAVLLCMPEVAHAGHIEVVDEMEPHDPPYAHFVADPGEANRITVTRSGDVLRLRDDGAPLRVGAGCERTSSNEASCRATSAVEADLGDGDDTFFTAERALVSGGDGDDTITAGDTRGGGPGDDTLTGGPRRDDLGGGGG